MRCDFCENKATVFLTQFVDEEMKKLCLCETCAEERGVTDPVGLSLGEPSFEGVENQTVSPEGRTSATSCPTCGFTLAKLKKVGRLGCANCYRVFAPDISQMILGMHKGFKHEGRVPQGLAEKHALRRQLEELQVSLQQAISNEAFEDAARLRDEISKLEGSSAAV